MDLPLPKLPPDYICLRRRVFFSHSQGNFSRAATASLMLAGRVSLPGLSTCLQQGAVAAWGDVLRFACIRFTVSALASWPCLHADLAIAALRPNYSRLPLLRC